MTNAHTTEIGILIYPGCQMAAVLGLTDILREANRMAQEKLPRRSSALLQVSHWEREEDDALPRRIFASGDGAPSPPAVLVLPPALEHKISPEEARSYAAWLNALHDKGTTLASVCGGALILGETGLFKGRTVTTHWAYRDIMRARFPEAILDTDRLMIDDGDIFTAGGVMAWTDLGLTLVDRFLGPTVMMDTSRLFLIDPPGREQRYYSAFAPNFTHGDAQILKLQHWLQNTQASQTDLSSLSRVSGLEERTLLRRFRKATGWTTSEYVQRLRVAKAQDLLQFSNSPADRIAWDVGYQDPSAFRRVFRRIVGLTPSDYRRRFAG
ncbi:GlxA family transcriptional regulator [Altericroceibacterium endophyticum]|uniref:Helix-turn-helix domain-containing protein n=1 Tax=Altericroceibacterium endophyticum TaxID=1808508 RepID=A0A6I4T5C2_9SPHN|nr:GlxA family transcriptional regulator [Altericroceibacterium endophyticum]MXO65402.1 helix-turn-helix domain-containing protein [Altericroceibacterium endophyticum]